MPIKKTTQTKKTLKKPVKKVIKVESKKPTKKEYGNGFGITGLVLGILSLVCITLLPPIGIILGIFGIVFSAVQQKRTPTGVGTAGLITSIIGLILSIVMTILLIFAFFAIKEFFIPRIGNLKEIFSGLPLNNTKNLSELKDLLSHLPMNLTQ